MSSQDLSNYRKSYDKFELLAQNCPNNPLELFKQWFEIADATEAIHEANAMTLSTIDIDGFPKSRVVLLKKYDNQGFVFYTNYNSNKGIAIEKTPNVCLSFFWPSLEQQIIIKGSVEKLSEKLSDEYFNSRPRGSRLGAWASNQSSVVLSRDELDQNLAKFKEQFNEKSIHRPLHWGGYTVKPISIEFWQGRPNRMHDRILYTLKQDFSWRIDRLAP